MGQGPLTREPSVAAKKFNNVNAAVLGAAVQAFAGPGNLWRLVVENNNAAVAYLQIFDLLSGSVVVGTTVPKETFMIPASGAIVIDPSDFPIDFFVLACSIAATTTRAGAVAGSLNVKLWYKN